MGENYTFTTPLADETRAEAESYLSNTFGSHHMNVNRIVSAYLQEHPDKASEALALSSLNIPRINVLSYLRPLIADAVAWWQDECAAIAKLAD